MNLRSLAIVTAAGLAPVLVGCQPMQAMPGPAPALLSDCPLTVPFGRPDQKVPCANRACGTWVQVINVQGVCTVVVEAAELKMGKGNGGFDEPGRKGVQLEWTIPRSEQIPWEFREEPMPYTLPVNFKEQAAPQLQTQFGRATVSRDKSTATVLNLNTYKYDYNFRIRVYRKGTNTFIESPDPVIVNDP